jgi:hypothetical protein
MVNEQEAKTGAIMNLRHSARKSPISQSLKRIGKVFFILY